MTQRDPSAVSLEIFVLNQLSTLCQETSGRGAAQRDVREAARKLLEELAVADFGKPGSRLSVPFPADVTAQLLGVLRGALALGNPRLAEPALSCMHKLVAYAYMQGETGPSGRLDDEANVVTQVVGLTARCGESSSAATQLQVVKALLTYVTAEHFLAHGDCLMQAVRTVFNIAIGAESTDIRNTARSALLQMVNTVLKRVGQQILSPNGTPLPSPSPTMFRPWPATSTTISGAAAALATERGGSTSSLQSAGGNPSVHSTTSAGEEFAAAAAVGGSREGAGVSRATSESGVPAAVSGGGKEASHTNGGDESPSQPLSPADSGRLMEALSAEMSVPAPSGGSPAGADAAGPGADSGHGSAGVGVAAAADMAAQDADMAELQAALPRIQTSPPMPTAPAGDREAAGGNAEQFVAAAVEADARTAQLASLAEQSDLRGLERALDSLPQAEPSSARGSSFRRQDTPPDPRRALMRDRRAAAWRLLTHVEKDALIVLTAMCKMAARETGFGAVESYMHQGKLLALDLLVRVLTNPMHDWSHVRPEFAAELRQPLCLVLLRNCMSPYDTALTAAVRLFEAILSAQKLRAGLKAELGALYPLLLLKPIEAAAPESAHAVVMAAEGVLHVCSHPQVLVDLFVNYDCSLQAANLYERTIKGVKRLLALPEAGTAALPAAVAQKLKGIALKALLAAIKSLDTWAGPIKSAAAAVALAPDAGAAGQGGSSGELGGGGGSEGDLAPPRDKQELQRILADKELKEALLAGIQLFNQSPVKGLRALVASGAIPDASAAAAARFLRDHAARLDKSQVGELMGHHDEHSIEVMHAYIDAEHFGGLALDEALRKLLGNFRLPGEAQKIDRIMEKFAERYCRDNPAAFGTADGAYLLAFAIIMLNTDAHNPMADRRISANDFVSMAQCQVEGSTDAEGGALFAQILPTDDLLDIYRRITENEIKVQGDEDLAVAPSNRRQRGSGDRKADSSRRAKLAAAVGVTQMVLPFWSGATWDKQHGVDVERKRLLEFTRQMMASSSGAVAGNIWHTATHAEHARPMMQVSGDAFLQCLKMALQEAPNMHVALQILGGYEQAVRLAALLRLDGICEALVAGLAEAAGLAAPAPHSSAAEAKQVAALSKLVSLGSCSEAGMLGPSWLILLRALSQLERLQAQLLPGSKDGLPPLPEGVAAIMASASLDAVAVATAAAAAAQVPAMPPPPPSSSGFGRLLQRMGFSSSGSASSPGSGDAGRSGLLAIKDAPGAGHVLWAETAGIAAIERLYSNSASLHGDAVMAFMRALCAVSQEELHPGGAGERPRVGLLQRVVECAYHNMARIRLVWVRLWGVVAQHLISAACHTDAYVAMYAVDALRQLTAKLLDRAELARFTHQGEALRPFAAVLRHSDSPAVRELAVACVAHAVSAHPRGLGSGWRSVVEALGLAARDSSPAVAGQALDALQPVVEALFRSAGHTLLRECVAAVLAGAENPHGFEELSVGALYLFQTLARRLEEALLAGTADSDVLLAALADVFAAVAARSPTPAEKHVPPAITAAVAAATTAAEQPAAMQGRERSASQPAELPIGGSGGSIEMPQSLWRSSSQPALQHRQQQPQQPGEGVQGAVERPSALADGVAAAWQAVLVPLAAVARLDVRPRVADAAAAVLLQIFKLHGDGLSPQLWLLLYQAALAPLLALPEVMEAEAAAAARLDGAHLALPSPRAPREAAAGGGSSPLVSSTHGWQSASGGPGAVAADGVPTAVPAALSLEGLDRLERHASAHMPDLWQLILEGSQASTAPSGELPPIREASTSRSSQHLHRTGSSSSGGGSTPTHRLPQRLALLWQPALQLLQQYISFPAESAAVLGVNQLHNLLLAASPALDASSWQAAVVALQAVCLRDPWHPEVPASLEPSAAALPAALGTSASSRRDADGSLLAAASAAEAIRRRSRLSVLLQRVLDSLLLQRMAAMPGQVQLQLLELLHRTVQAAAAINNAPGRRAAAEHALAAGAAAAAHAHLGGSAGKAAAGSSSAWALAADATAAAMTGVGSNVGPPSDDASTVSAGLLPLEGDDGEGGGDAAWEQLRPALVRQEAEGGCLYISALQRCMRGPTSSNGTEAAVAAECEARLANFCLWVVQGAAERAAGSGSTDAEPSGKPADPAAAAAAVLAVASPGPSTPAAGGAPNPADLPWEDAVRAPLVDAALQAYGDLSPAAWGRQQGAAFPHLARLVCSPSRGVRRALRSLLQRQVPSVLAGVEAGGAGAGAQQA